MFSAASVSVSVCLSVDNALNLKRFDLESSFFGTQVHLTEYLDQFRNAIGSWSW